MDTIITAVLSAIGGGLVAAFSLGAKTVFSKNKAAQDTLKALSHDALFRQCRQLIDKGSVSESELENLEYLFKAYHALGLNGSGQNMYERCLDLPLEEK